jgi:hypothetical protein
MIEDPPRFLDELCVRLDICLPPAGRGRVSVGRFRDMDALEETILESEGIDPLTMDRYRRHELRELIARFWVGG